MSMSHSPLNIFNSYGISLSRNFQNKSLGPSRVHCIQVLFYKKQHVLKKIEKNVNIELRYSNLAMYDWFAQIGIALAL